MRKHDLLFENLITIKDYWTSKACDSLNPITDLIWSDDEDAFKILQTKLSSIEEQEAFKSVQNEIIRGVMHSLLVMIDGGDALADKMKIDIVDEATNQSLKEGIALHEEFISYLLDLE